MGMIRLEEVQKDLFFDLNLKGINRTPGDPRPPEGIRETEVAADHAGASEGSIISLKGLPFCLSLFHLVSKTASAAFPNTISNSSAVNSISVFGFLIASTHSASGVNTFGLGKPLPNITL